MDGQQFDRLVRAVAGRGSRRGIVHGLAGAAVLLATGRTASPVVARNHDLAPGEPCRNDGQCVNSGTTCDYVGQTDDYRCCSYEGGPCGGDQSCCGWLVCPPGDFSGAFCASACTSVGCPCIAGTSEACDGGLMCCAQGDPGAPGTCLTVDACYVAMSYCTWEGCSCATAAQNACGDGLFCCGEGDVGTCQTAAKC